MAALSNAKKGMIFAGIAVFVFVSVIVGMSLTKDMGKSEDEKTSEQTSQKMDELLKGVTVTNVTARKAAISDSDILSEEDELPDIKSYPLSVTGNGELNIEIFSSPEKAGEGTDGWLNEVAKNFNNEKISINGKTATVSIRSVSSGLAVDYITSGKYVPDAITPSNEFWGKMIEAKKVKVTLKEKRLVGNTAGVLFSKSKYDEIIKKYGSVNTLSSRITPALNNSTAAYPSPLWSRCCLLFSKLGSSVQTTQSGPIASRKYNMVFLPKLMFRPPSVTRFSKICTLPSSAPNARQLSRNSLSLAVINSSSVK